MQLFWSKITAPFSIVKTVFVLISSNIFDFKNSGKCNVMDAVSSKTTKVASLISFLNFAYISFQSGDCSTKSYLFSAPIYFSTSDNFGWSSMLRYTLIYSFFPTTYFDFCLYQSIMLFNLNTFTTTFTAKSFGTNSLIVLSEPKVILNMLTVGVEGIFCFHLINQFIS